MTADGARVVTGSAPLAMVWDAETGACLHTVQDHTATCSMQQPGHTDYFSGVAISVDGARVVTGSMDKLTKV